LERGPPEQRCIACVKIHPQCGKLRPLLPGHHFLKSKELLFSVFFKISAARFDTRFPRAVAIFRLNQ
jgi:hypothetical protein